MAVLAMSVVRQSRMNSRIVNATSSAATTRWNFTSSIERTINRDWSRTTKVSMSAGRTPRSSSRRFPTRSTTSTVLSPDCFCTIKLTAALPLSRASPRGSSKESSTWPTSLIRTG